jgi:N-acetylglucosamine-6-sulfatase
MTVALTTLASFPSQSVVAQAVPTSPNVVLIVVDDQRWDMLSTMPTVQSTLVGPGMAFAEAFVPDPLCCPSRTSILRGQYSHTTRIYGVSGPFGGYGKVKKFGLQESMLPTWLHDAGYRTGFTGKYMNLYDPARATEVPPGWDLWAALAPDSPSAYYYDYSLSFSENGQQPATIVSRGTSEDDYSTRVFSRYAQQFISETPADQPLFLEFAPSAPHGPFTPDPMDAEAACSLNPQVPSFGEPDTSDKPGWVAIKPWTTTTANQNRNRWLKQCRALLGVDRAVGEIIGALEATDRISNTLIIYTSDNGMMHGEHRLSGKKAPYEESIRVPLIVRYDGVVPAGITDHHLVLNVDLAPTVLEATGVAAPATLPCSLPCQPAPIEGTSLFPLFARDASGWRKEILIEHYDLPSLSSSHNVPPYCAVRTANGMKYIRYDPDREGRFEELYDLRTDPFELKNRIDDPALAWRLVNLRLRLQGLCAPTPPDYGFE